MKILNFLLKIPWKQSPWLKYWGLEWTSRIGQEDRHEKNRKFCFRGGRFCCTKMNFMDFFKRWHKCKKAVIRFWILKLFSQRFVALNNAIFHFWKSNFFDFWRIWRLNGGNFQNTYIKFVCSTYFDGGTLYFVPILKDRFNDIFIGEKIEFLLKIADFVFGHTSIKTKSLLKLLGS